MGRVDILVNNAGTNAPQPIDQIDDPTWDNVMEINLNSDHGPDAGPGAADEGAERGRIVHISSIMGFVSKEKRNVYSATKTAPLGLRGPRPSISGSSASR